jgi:uncharacterized repeat protein (TIGR01451 family)
MCRGSGYGVLVDAVSLGSGCAVHDLLLLSLLVARLLHPCALTLVFFTKTMINLKNVLIRGGIAAAVVGVFLPSAAFSYTRAGTEISTPAQAVFDFGPQRLVARAPKWGDTVDELVDVELQSLEPGPVPAGIGSSNQVVRFQVSNLGNGDEAFSLAVNSAVAGDQFDPEFVSVWLDDGDGIFSSVTDTLYVSGVNEPVLGMAGSGTDQLTVFVLNHMPSSATVGQEGISELSTESLSATGAGTNLDGAGEDGTDLVVGFTDGRDSDSASYIIGQATVEAMKSVELYHPDHGVLTEAFPGATLRYTIRITVSGIGTLENITFRDPIPPDAEYTTGSLSLNGVSLTDSAGDDAGEFNALTNEVVARLGRLSAADGEQVIVFETKMKEVQP